MLLILMPICRVLKLQFYKALLLYYYTSSSLADALVAL